MSGGYNSNKKVSFAGGWSVHEKRAGGQYDKYDTQIVIIVGAVRNGKDKKPHTIYFSKKAYEEMGRPKHIEVRYNGTSVGFFPVPEKDAEENRNAYTVSYSGEFGKDDKGEGRAMMSARSIIAEHDLRPGAYVASVYIEGSVHAIVINSNDRPSTV